MNASVHIAHATSSGSIHAMRLFGAPVEAASGIMRGMTKPKTKPSPDTYPAPNRRRLPTMIHRLVSFVILIAAAPFGVASCRSGPAAGPVSLHYVGPFTCEPELRDNQCGACLKQQCCAPMRACNEDKKGCACGIKCVRAGDLPACYDACPEADKAMHACASTACAVVCSVTGESI